MRGKRLGARSHYPKAYPFETKRVQVWILDRVPRLFPFTDQPFSRQGHTVNAAGDKLASIDRDTFRCCCFLIIFPRNMRLYMWLKPHFLPHFPTFVNKYAAKHAVIAAYYAAYARTQNHSVAHLCAKLCPGYRVLKATRH